MKTKAFIEGWIKSLEEDRDDYEAKLVSGRIGMYDYYSAKLIECKIQIKTLKKIIE